MPEILVVCYSYTGNTLRVAEEIGRLTNGTMCSIYPWQPYPPDYQELVRQARREIREGYCPRLLPADIRTEEYDVIFVGTPNWCGTLAPPLASFLTAHDFSGKIMIPFCTHGGGGIGNVAKDIAALCPKTKMGTAFHTMGDGGPGLKRELGKWLGGLSIVC
ncbi:MAG: flavodoxin [Clostridium sp.]|nr:flavodoxin [Clostridium sp.]